MRKNARRGEVVIGCLVIIVIVVIIVLVASSGGQKKSVTTTPSAPSVVLSVPDSQLKLIEESLDQLRSKRGEVAGLSEKEVKQKVLEEYDQKIAALVARLAQLKAGR